jgi:hypothetical protein
MIGPNTFRAAVVAPPGESPVQFGYWCPWCETSHAHGLAGMTTTEAIGANEPRGSHCDPHRSPLAGKGVDLTIDRVVRSWEHLEPPGPFPTWRGDSLNTRLRLGEVLGDGLLGVALMRMVFGKHRPASGFDARLVGGWVQVWSGGSSWFLHNEARATLAEGRGLGALLARLFGVPIGVVAVRVIEDALALNLPSDYRVLLAGLVDRAARGEPLPSFAEGGA